jgi:hypothetical protein
MTAGDMFTSFDDPNGVTSVGNVVSLRGGMGLAEDFGSNSSLEPTCPAV